MSKISCQVSFVFEQSTRTQAKYRPTVSLGLKEPMDRPSLVSSVMINHKLA